MEKAEGALEPAPSASHHDQKKQTGCSWQLGKEGGEKSMEPKKPFFSSGVALASVKPSTLKIRRMYRIGV